MSEQEMLRHYSAALDEIYRLRRQLAYEADVLKVHLEYKTFPKSRRQIAEDQIRRMRASARGDRDSTLPVSRRSLDLSMREAGAEDSLTRSQWEAGR